jgi:hypothetical protein
MSAREISRFRVAPLLRYALHMKPSLGATFALLCGLSVVTACDVGGGDGDGGDGTMTPDPNNPNRYACTSGYTITGTFAPSGTRPAEVGGCWPAGTWTFSAAIDPAYEAVDITGDGVGDKCLDSDMPTLAATYSITVTKVKDAEGRWDETVTYNGDMAELNRIKISEGGNRECTAGIELFLNDDYDFVNLAPTQDFEETNLLGKGDFKRFLDKQTRFGADD